MRLKVIQINIYHGKFLDKLISFLRGEQPDIITMQEVSGGRVNFWADQRMDIFQHLRSALGLEGVVAPMFRLIGDSSSYESNAVLARGKILASNTVQLKAYRDYSDLLWEKDGPEMPRNALDVIVRFSPPARGGSPLLPEEGRGVVGEEGVGEGIFHILSTHGAWTKAPVDTPEKIRQARLLAEYLRGLGDEPFILGGDFNMEPGSEVIRILDKAASNTCYGSGINNTLNLRTHRAAEVLGAGRLVDFIYTSPHFRVESIDAPEVDVSDHLPVRAMLSWT
ncbi:endonuclease/exonuclease/phosphatase family protein [Candidatus Uhrbacteria bacterium]|nr:endonuclease/exonuclease/phosphatase family protein [Candidatus Uhrbacteria bacterium]